jgi:hypothetical protein
VRAHFFADDDRPAPLGGRAAGDPALLAGLARALAKQTGPIALVVLRRESGRFGPLDTQQSLLALVDALGASIAEPARRASFLKEAHHIVLDARDGGGA